MASVDSSSNTIITEDYPDAKTIKTLSNSLVSLYQPDLIKVKRELNELILKQNRLQGDLAAENGKFTENNFKTVQDMMDKMKIYKEKLLNVKKQMSSIHHRIKILKKKAHDIQEFKQKELLQKIQKRNQEEALIAKSSVAK